MGHAIDIKHGRSLGWYVYVDGRCVAYRLTWIAAWWIARRYRRQVGAGLAPD